MAIGFPVTKSTVDQNLGVCARALYEAFHSVERFQAWLDTVTTNDLETLGYSPTEANVVKSIGTDLDHLRQVWEGTAGGDPADEYDHRRFAKQAVGPGF